jgi:adenosine deaminase
MQISDELIRSLPKTDLHLHLDGSLRISTLIELARIRKVPLPSETPEGLYELVFKPHYAGLGEYLQGFAYTTAVLQDPESIERTAYELCLDNIEEGVRYLEMRFAPQLHVSSRLSLEDTLVAVGRGIARAETEHRLSDAVRVRGEPPFRAGIIVCAMRMFEPNFSWYYYHLSQVLSGMERRARAGIASLQLAREAIRVRDEIGLPIVGFDLAGQERGYPAVDHQEAYQYAHEHFLKKTVHAGEAYGPESIFQAITALHADRIGHGYHLFSPELITNPQVQDRARYIQELAEYIADRRITIEVCITSNLQTNPSIGSVEKHRFRDMLDARLSTTLCTDNRLISHTSVSQELRLAIDHFGITREGLRDIVVYGFKRSFFPGDYREKRRYVRSVLDYYEKVIEESREFGPGESLGAAKRPS